MLRNEEKLRKALSTLSVCEEHCFIGSQMFPELGFFAVNLVERQLNSVWQGVRWVAQRPVLRVKEPKNAGVRSARANNAANHTSLLL